MRLGNRYFAFQKPVRWFRAVGLSDSNTYIGASRAIDTVHAQVLAEPGDVIHSLGGGTFLVRADGRIETGRFKLPKHIFEKTYGRPETDLDLLVAMEDRGLCAEIDAPAGPFDYAAPRRAVDARRFPPCTGSTTTEGYVPSPVLEELKRLAEVAGLPAAVTAAGGEMRTVDVGLGGDPNTLEAQLALTLPEARRIDLRLAPTFKAVLICTSEAASTILDAVAAAQGTLEHRSPTIAFAPLDSVEPILIRLRRELH